MELTGGRGLQSSSFYFACTLSSDSLLDTSRRALKGHKEYLFYFLIELYGMCAARLSRSFTIWPSFFSVI